MIPMGLHRLRLTLIALSLAASASAQVLVGPQGSGVLTFDTAPLKWEWATESFGGDSGGTGIIDAAGLDAQVQLVSASAVDLELATTQLVPPTQNNYVRWNTNGAYLQSRPGNVEFTVLMTTLVNGTSTALQTVEVGYDLGGGFPSPEHVPGFRGYYSFTGEAGTWIVIPEFCTGLTGRVSAVLSFAQLGVWFAGAPLYLLWADDNGPNSDGYYTIDNFRVSLGPALSLRRTEDGAAEVSWPAAWWNHFLEVSPSLSQPDWRLAIGTITRSDGRMQMLLEAAEGQRFFRTRGSIILDAARVAPR